MKIAACILAIGLVASFGCKYTGSDGVDKLSAEDRAIVTRFGFPQWHKLEKAHYGRGLEHAVLVAAATVSGKPVDEVVALQKEIGQPEFYGGYGDAVLISGGLLAEARKPAATGEGVDQAP